MLLLRKSNDGSWNNSEIVSLATWLTPLAMEQRKVLSVRGLSNRVIWINIAIPQDKIAQILGHNDFTYEEFQPR